MLPVFQLSLPLAPAPDGQSNLLILNGNMESGSAASDTPVFVDLLSEQLSGEAMSGNTLPPHGKPLPQDAAQRLLPFVEEQIDDESALQSGITDYHFAGSLPPAQPDELPIHALHLVAARTGDDPPSTTGLPRTVPTVVTDNVLTTPSANTPLTVTSGSSGGKAVDVTVHVPPTALPGANAADLPGTRRNAAADLPGLTLHQDERRPMDHMRRGIAESYIATTANVDDQPVTGSQARGASLMEQVVGNSNRESQQGIGIGHANANQGSTAHDRSLAEAPLLRSTVSPIVDPLTLQGAQPNAGIGSDISSEFTQHDSISLYARDTAAAHHRSANGSSGDVSIKPIPLPLADVNWGKDLVQRVSVMTNHRLQTAEIRLSPAEMGPIRINVSIEDGTANIAFQAHHAITREAIDLALPKLREMLLEQGLTPGHTDVRDDSPRERQSRLSDDVVRTSTDRDAVDDETAEPLRSTTQRSTDGLLDTFA